MASPTKSNSRSPGSSQKGSSPPKGASPIALVEPGEQPMIEAEVYSENESAYSDSDLESFTTSLTSSVENYQYENGRRYHAFRPGQYYLPNDEREIDRLDLTHHTMTIALGGKLHAAPVDRPQKILDIGTGSGIWAIEMADQYPSAHVVGNDLSPIQPKWVPPNVSFEVDDVESEWTHPDDTFDYIFCRYMLGSIKDWERLFCQAFKALKPGGYLEVLDPDSTLRCSDDTLTPDSALLEWDERFIKSANTMGRSVVSAPRYAGWMRDAGFVDVDENIIILPNSPWPKDKHLRELGGYHMAAFMEGLEGMSLRLFTHFGGMDVPAIQVLLARTRKDLRNRALHTYFHLHSIVARKPE
ncbi:hypothetical protein Dda_9021 [Drechslerella dactyloides]|uniref:Methyltransferase n=1 Tax=Drechslerella dactyloides TaxID=74499 RepID=A0AAD6ISK2_DREDA|nr:hypothetical protein Dda_9021 [Drechslerella dactyloides]